MQLNEITNKLREADSLHVTPFDCQDIQLRRKPLFPKSFQELTISTTLIMNGKLPDKPVSTPSLSQHVVSSRSKSDVTKVAPI